MGADTTDIDPRGGAELRVIVCEDHAPLRRRVILALEEDPGIVVVGEAADSGVAGQLCRELAPDCVIVGTALPPLGGPSAIARVRAASPTAVVVMMGSGADEGAVLASVRAGATGFLNRELLAQAPAVVRAVDDGVVAVPPLVARLLLDAMAAERTVERGAAGARTRAMLGHLAAGRPYSGAEAVGLTPAQARNLVANAVERLTRGPA